MTQLSHIYIYIYIDYGNSFVGMWTLNMYHLGVFNSNESVLHYNDTSMTTILITCIPLCFIFSHKSWRYLRPWWEIIVLNGEQNVRRYILSVMLLYSYSLSLHICYQSVKLKESTRQTYNNNSYNGNEKQCLLLSKTSSFPVHNKVSTNQILLLLYTCGGHIVSIQVWSLRIFNTCTLFNLIWLKFHSDLVLINNRFDNIAAQTFHARVFHLANAKEACTNHKKRNNIIWHLGPFSI